MQIEIPGVEWSNSCLLIKKERQLSCDIFSCHFLHILWVLTLRWLLLGCIYFIYTMGEWKYINKSIYVVQSCLWNSLRSLVIQYLFLIIMYVVYFQEYFFSSVFLRFTRLQRSLKAFMGFQVPWCHRAVKIVIESPCVVWHPDILVKAILQLLSLLLLHATIISKTGPEPAS